MQRTNRKALDAAGKALMEALAKAAHNRDKRKVGDSVITDGSVWVNPAGTTRCVFRVDSDQVIWHYAKEGRATRRSTVAAFVRWAEQTNARKT